MTVIGKWNGHKFGVSKNAIRGFYDLKINGSSDTEDKKSGGEQYVNRKNGKPLEISLSIILNSALGSKVRTEAMTFISQAQEGAKDYFYIGKSKLCTCQLMLVKADIQDVIMSAKGTWVSAKVGLTLKQCTKGDGSTGGSSSGGGGKKSVKNPGTTTPKANPQDKWGIWDRNSGVTDRTLADKARYDIKKRKAQAATALKNSALKNQNKNTFAGGTKVMTQR